MAPAATTKTDKQATSDAPKVAVKPATVDLQATQQKIQAIISEQQATHYERTELVTAFWHAIIANQHLLMVGPGGTGKSFLTRDTAKRVTGAAYFEVAMDETTTPDQILGPPDIKSMVEDGKTRRVPDGMMPTAHIAFLDEFFNANGPALHSTMPLLNERIFHNNGKPVPIPLRTAFMGTNKLNSDVDQAALWDRVHHRHVVGYVSDRDHLHSLIDEAMLRQVSTYEDPSFTTVTLNEIDAAHDAAMSLPVSDIAFTTFLDIKEELERNGVVVSTRRLVEAMKGVLAMAWTAGHDEVKVGDLGILRHMLWTTQDQMSVVKTVVLNACNPGEKKALDLLDELDKFKVEYQQASELDEIKRNTAAIDIFKKAQRLIDEAQPLLDTATAAGASTQRISDLIDSAGTLREKIGVECFNMDAAQIANLPTNRR
jgi:MoxR-like ATPase